MDSLPKNIFDIFKDRLKGKSFPLDNQGLTDSGPCFTSLSTGALANKYLSNLDG